MIGRVTPSETSQVIMKLWLFSRIFLKCMRVPFKYCGLIKPYLEASEGVQVFCECSQVIAVIDIS